MCESCVGNREVRDRRSWNADSVEEMMNGLMARHPLPGLDPASP